jgi:hypothetical protein
MNKMFQSNWLLVDGAVGGCGGDCSWMVNVVGMGLLVYPWMVDVTVGVSMDGECDYWSHVIYF